MGQAVGSTNIEPMEAFRVVADRVGLGGHHSRESRFSKGELARTSALYNASNQGLVSRYGFFSWKSLSRAR
jgi:hypothetical protein